MPRRCSETRAVKRGIWIQKEKIRGEKLQKKLLRMRNMLNGEKGKSINYYLKPERARTCVMYGPLNKKCLFRLAQEQMQQQKLEDALHESQKPLARHYDDEDLDRMLREQERDGDPMAAMLRRKKERNTKTPSSKRSCTRLWPSFIIVKPSGVSGLSKQHLIKKLNCFPDLIHSKTSLPRASTASKSV